MESSGLAFAAGLLVTTNDSGDSGRLFAVDPSTGATASVTDWAADAHDVEALAPGRPGEVWVGDIGDNGAEREMVTVTRVSLRDGALASYQLAYPERAVDAETLLAHPRTGRLFVISKEVFGGTVYAAPPRLAPDRVNPLTEVATVRGLATDGAFFPDGRHVIVRGYDTATVYAWPTWSSVGSLDLPRQEQGEGIAVEPSTGGVVVSSEGLSQPVLGVALPDRLRWALAAPPGRPWSVSASPSPSGPASPSPGPGEPDPSEVQAVQPERWPWLMGGGLFVIALLVLLRSLRNPNR